MILISLIAMASFSFGAADFQLVKPAEIKQLPAQVRKALEEDKCLVPSDPKAKEPIGWTKGKFADKRQTDFAVLCSAPSGKTKIKVVWGGRDFACPDSIAQQPSRIQRTVQAVPFKKLVDVLRKGKRDTPKHFEADGIQDYVVQKKALVYFCNNGRWESIR